MSKIEPEEVFYECEEQPDLFRKLPNEILNNVFNFLDRGSKIAFSAVCKRFDSVFSEPINLKNFTLTLDIDTHRPFPDFQRKYQDVVIKNFVLPANSEEKSKILKVRHTLGPHLKEIKFLHCNISDRFVAELMENCPNIESLNFDECIVEKLLQNAHIGILLKLESIQAHGNVFEALVNVISNVRTLKTITFMRWQHIAMAARIRHNYNAVKKIVARQKNLKTLEIADGKFFNSPLNNVSFQLDKIVLFIPVLRERQSENLNEFLLSQYQFSDVVYNIRANEYMESVHEAIRYIINMESMRKLRIVFYNESGMVAAYRDGDTSNNRIEDLFVSFRAAPFSHRRLIEATSKMFPNLLTLHIKVDSEWLDVNQTSLLTFEPLNSLQRLTKLSLEGVDTRLITGIEIPTLESFDMVDLIEPRQQELTTFFNHNPMLSHLKFSVKDQTTNHQLVLPLIELAILRLRHLIELKLCSNGHSLSPNYENRLRSYNSRHGSGSLQMFSVCGKLLLF